MATPALPPLLTAPFLTALRTSPRLPPQTWYFIAGVALSALNRPDEIPRVLRHALEHGPAAEQHAERLRLARRMREGLVKSAAIVGLPKTINALLALKTGTPAELLDEAGGPSSPSSRAAELRERPPAEVLARGQAFFDRVYGKVTQRVMGQMDNSGTEDLGVTARLMYGYVLSNTKVLGAADSSVVLLAGLVPQDVNPQLKGHLKGAINNGVTLDQVRAVREAVIGICEAAGMVRLADEAKGGWGWRNEVAKL